MADLTLPQGRQLFSANLACLGMALAGLGLCLVQNLL